jgi:hypothetical protein
MDGSGNPWCTNRWGGSADPNALTYGILNQIQAGWTGYSDNRYVRDADLDLPIHTAADAFRYNLSPNGSSNVFCAPLAPVTSLCIQTRWQANDPLVHYIVGDLRDSSLPVDYRFPLRADIGRLNLRYDPWGGNPVSGPRSTRFDLTVKDPLVNCSDNWNFPSAEPLSLAVLGRVHRGTPWQTVYLKSATTDLSTWQRWTGIADEHEAQLTHPTNDWRLASLLAPLLETNTFHLLLSLNNPDANLWHIALDGVNVLTNITDDVDILSPPAFDTIVMSSNAPQAAVIASAILSARGNGTGRYFRDISELLAVPRLSVTSPWLNLSLDQPYWGITDEAYEKIPGQLLSRLRADSIGTISSTNGQYLAQFTGYDDHSYRIEVSSNLADWAGISTNYPTNGVFSFRTTAPSAAQFYRSILLP